MTGKVGRPANPNGTTKPEMKRDAKRVMVLQNVRMGLESIVTHELVTLSIALGKRLRLESRHPCEGFTNLGSDPVYNQLVRSLNSVGANYAEGFARVTYEYRLSFFLISRGSAYESVIHAETLNLNFVDDLKYLCGLVDKVVEDLINEETAGGV